MTAIVDLMVNGLASSSDDERRARAWAVLSILIGGSNVARAVKHESAAEEIGHSVRAAALKAAGRAR